MSLKVDVVKEPTAKGVVHYVVDRYTRKVLGKYIIGSTIKVEEFPEEKEEEVIKLTVNGFDN